MQSSLTQQPGPFTEDPSGAELSHPETLPLAISPPPWLTHLTTDANLRNRILTHGTMLLVVMVVIGLSQYNLPWGNFQGIRPLRLTTTEKDSSLSQPQPVDLQSPLTLSSKIQNTLDSIVQRNPVLRTIIPDRSAPADNPALSLAAGQIQTYVVQSGDNISNIALKFGLDADTLVWSNSDLENAPDRISIGQELTILPVNGVYHQVGGGDTVEGIAATFKTSPDLIINFPANQLDPQHPVLSIGQWLVVPGGSKPFKPRTVAAYVYTGPIPEGALIGSGAFDWPTSGSISQGFSAYHPAIDIMGYIGAPVMAADSGFVVAAGWDNTGYGNEIVIDHGNGYQSLYAHLNAFLVNVGDNVAKGQQIAEMGSTGNSTGPHLHFEVRQGTIQRNPYGVLP
jgi:LysM repeat protein